MSKFNPIAGDIVYNEDGFMAEYVVMSGGCHIVRPIYNDQGDDEPCFGSTSEWRKVYAAPPVDKASAEVEELRKEATRLHSEVQKMHEERRALESDAKRRIALLQRHEKLSSLEDFLNGKLTHYALFPGYMPPHVLAVQDAKSNPEDRWSKDLRLLSLFGRSNGDITWMLHRYYDGSGGDRCEVIPCRSEDEAKEVIRKRAVATWEVWRKEPNTWYACREMMKASATVGFDVPEDVKAHAKEMDTQQAQKSIEAAQAALDAANRAMAIAQAQ